jgi:hypothetical protein
MSAVNGKLENGKVVLAESVDWPEGTQVRVEPLTNGGEIIVHDDLQGGNPESIARWLAWYDSLEPLIFTPEEEAALRTAREEDKEREKAAFADRSEKLRRLFE